MTREQPSWSKNSEAEARLIPTLMELLKDKAKQEDMKNNIAQFARPNAAENIVDIIIKAIEK